jgi:hypothetical protein
VQRRGTVRLASERDWHGEWNKGGKEIKGMRNIIKKVRDQDNDFTVIIKLRLQLVQCT